MLNYSSHYTSLHAPPANFAVEHYRKTDLVAADERLRLLFKNAESDQAAEIELAGLISEQKERNKVLKSVRLVSPGPADPADSGARDLVARARGLVAGVRPL